MPDAFKPKSALCAGCDWRDVGRGYAAGDGDPNADLWVVPESLGENEARIGKPLQGFTGKLVDKALAAAGRTRASVFCINTICCMPPPNAGKKKKIPKHITEYCTNAHLKPLLDAHSPKVIIAVGEYALNYLTGRTQITKQRGSVIPLNDKTVCIPTIHYAAFAPRPGEKARINVLKPFVDYDYAKAVGIAANGYTPVIRNYEIRPTLDRVVTTLDRIKRSRIPVFLDIETSGGAWWDTLPLCLGVYYEDQGLCIPFYGHRGEDVWSSDEFDTLIERVGDFLADEEIEKTFQNGNSDVMVLESVGF